MSKPGAAQQPDWGSPELVAQVRDELAGLPGLVTEHDVNALRAALAEVAAGKAQVLQAGDCAEDPAESTPSHLARKTGLIDMLAGLMKTTTRKPVLRVGRIAGQYAKPRSSPTEVVDGVELPVYRGHMVNEPEPELEARRPDPKRILLGYWAASEAMETLRPTRFDAPLWTSHEALLLDYEEPMLRRADGGTLLSSTHWPWIGDRTRQPDGAHVAMLAGVVNPVACKVGPGMTTGNLLEIVDRLDPLSEPGRLTLIARMGAGVLSSALPSLVAAVRAEGHPVIWLTDPMHGNTVRTPDGLKTRFVETVTQEVREFQEAVRAAGGVAGGLHLETTPDHVTECVLHRGEIDKVGDKYTSLCDPRLTARQAFSVVTAWAG